MRFSTCSRLSQSTAQQIKLERERNGPYRSLFDFLDRKAGLVLAGQLARMVRKGGALYGTFGTTPIELKHYTRSVVVAEDSLRQRQSPASALRPGR